MGWTQEMDSIILSNWNTFSSDEIAKILTNKFDELFTGVQVD